MNDAKFYLFLVAFEITQVKSEHALYPALYKILLYLILRVHHFHRRWQHQCVDVIDHKVSLTSVISICQRIVYRTSARAGNTEYHEALL